MITATVRHDDADWIEMAIDRWAASLRWDLRGVAVTPLLMQELMWDGVARQVAMWRDHEEPVGLVQLTGIDLANGLANLEVLADLDRVEQMAPAVDGFLREAFGAFPLRKVMLHVGAGRLHVDETVCSSSPWSPLVRHAASYPAHLHAGAARFLAIDVFEIVTPESLVAA